MIMKKYLTAFLLTALLAVPGFAQKKGDNAVAFSVKLDLNCAATKIQTGNLTVKGEGSFQPGFSMWADYGRFLIDNLKVGAVTGYSHSASGLVKSQGKWYGSRYDMVDILPYVSYYVKITKFLYYTPEFGFGGIFGQYSEDVGVNSKIKYPAAGLYMFLQPALFECRVNQTWALGFGLGSVNLDYLTYFDKPNDTKYHETSFGLNFMGNFCVKAYF